MRAGAKLGRTDLQVIVVADAFPVLGLSGWRFLHLGLVSETLGSRDRRGLPSIALWSGCALPCVRALRSGSLVPGAGDFI